MSNWQICLCCKSRISLHFIFTFILSWSMYFTRSPIISICSPAQNVDWGFPLYMSTWCRICPEGPEQLEAVRPGWTWAGPWVWASRRGVWVAPPCGVLPQAWRCSWYHWRSWCCGGWAAQCWRWTSAWRHGWDWGTRWSWLAWAPRHRQRSAAAPGCPAPRRGRAWRSSAAPAHAAHSEQCSWFLLCPAGDTESVCVREEWGCGWNDNTGEREMDRNRKVGVKKEKVEWKKERWYEQQRRERREKIE